MYAIRSYYVPQVLNPPQGYVVTANHKIVPPEYPHYITAEWQPPYRAERIKAMLKAEPRHSVSSFARMQADAASLAVRELLPYLWTTRPRSELARRALERIAAWDGTMAVITSYSIHYTKLYDNRDN